jgi:hypothetical protein
VTTPLDLYSQFNGHLAELFHPLDSHETLTS